MKLPLDRLASIDFGASHHGGGPADEVPERLRDLLSPDAELRRDALDSLSSSLFHQDTVYPATVLATPFLVDLAAHPSTPDRHALLAFLRILLSVLPENRRDGLGPARAVKANERSDAAECSAVVEAIWRGAGVYLGLLADADPRVRSAALGVIPFADPSEAAANDVRALLAGETDPIVRSSALLALGALGRHLGDRRDQPLFVETLSAEHALVRTAAAIALVYLGPSEIPDAAFDVLGASGKLDLQPENELPWGGGDLAKLSAIALSALGELAPARTVATVKAILDARIADAKEAPRAVTPADVMIAKVMGLPIPELTQPPSPEQEARSWSARVMAEALLTVAFRGFEGRKQGEVTLAELSEQQRAILEYLALEHDVATVYARFGLPPREDMESFLYPPS